MTMPPVLRATYSHPVCGCMETAPFTVEIKGSDKWPKIKCGYCDCILHTSDVEVQTPINKPWPDPPVDDLSDLIKVDPAIQ